MPGAASIARDRHVVLAMEVASRRRSWMPAHHQMAPACIHAPEAFLGDPIPFSVDWWTLGCLTVEMLTGRPALWRARFTGN